MTRRVGRSPKPRDARWAALVAAVIIVTEVWLAVHPLDIRAGFKTALPRVVKVFSAAYAANVYLFATAAPID